MAYYVLWMAPSHRRVIIVVKVIIKIVWNSVILYSTCFEQYFPETSMLLAAGSTRDI